jgi:hypothetical protein
VAHNPRRDRTPAPPPVITSDQIVEAIARAVELRRRTANDPANVRANPLHPSDAVRMTENWRLHTRWYRIARGHDPEPDPWYWIGWISVEHPWTFTDPLGRRGYAATWAVCLNVEDGRVWLRRERHGRRGEDGDPYP